MKSFSRGFSELTHACHDFESNRMEEPYWPEASTDGRCGWCGQPLTEGEIFTVEMEVAAWEQGERLFAPEHPALYCDDDPIPSCRACRDSITTNFDQCIEELNKRSTFDRVTSITMIVILTSICMYVLLSLMRMM